MFAKVVVWLILVSTNESGIWYAGYMGTVRALLKIIVIVFGSQERILNAKSSLDKCFVSRTDLPVISKIVLHAEHSGCLGLYRYFAVSATNVANSLISKFFHSDPQYCFEGTGSWKRHLFLIFILLVVALFGGTAYRYCFKIFRSLINFIDVLFYVNNVSWKYATGILVCATEPEPITTVHCAPGMNVSCHSNAPNRGKPTPIATVVKTRVAEPGFYFTGSSSYTK